MFNTFKIQRTVKKCQIKPTAHLVQFSAANQNQSELLPNTESQEKTCMCVYVFTVALHILTTKRFKITIEQLKHHVQQCSALLQHCA